MSDVKYSYKGWTLVTDDKGGYAGDIFCPHNKCCEFMSNNDYEGGDVPTLTKQDIVEWVEERSQEELTNICQSGHRW